MRLDKYLKVSRIIKRRTVANEACDAGRVSLNGRQAKAGSEVRPGDEIAIQFGEKLLRYEVLRVSEHVTMANLRFCSDMLFPPCNLQARFLGHVQQHALDQRAGAAGFKAFGHDGHAVAALDDAEEP